MQWLKWTLCAAVGCLPILALADEPAKKDKDADKEEGPKIGLSIEVRTGNDRPKVFILGKGDGKESADLAKLLGEFAKHMEVKVRDAKNDKNPPLDEAAQAILKRTDDLARKAMTLTLRVHPPGEKGAFLGVGTSPPPTVLTKQLSLPEGMGLVADEVVPDGPAAKAGLKQYDVLEKLDDQLIVNFEQLAVLVHSHKPGDEVKLTVIHEGKPLVLTVKLTEHEMRLGMWDFEPEHEKIQARIKDLIKDRVWEIVPEKTAPDKTAPEKK